MRPRLFLASCALSTATVLAAPPSASVFSSSPGEATDDWAPVSEKLAKTIVTGGDPAERKRLDEGMKDNGLARNTYSPLLRARNIGLYADGRKQGLFVRPASTPRLAGWNDGRGARFWVLGEAGELLFSATGDRFAVLASIHENVHDLQVSQCQGAYCYDTVEVWRNGQYVDGACTKTEIASGMSKPGCR